MRLRDLDAKRFEALVQGVTPAVVMFGTDWCAPCRRLERVLTQELAETADRLLVAKVNVEDEPEIARRLEVVKSPTLCLIERGDVVRKHEGFLDGEALRRLLQDAAFPL